MENNPKLNSTQLQALPIEMVRYYHRQAEARLNDLIGASSSTTNRCYQLLSMQLGLLTLLSGVLFSEVHSVLRADALCLFITLVLSSACLFRVIFPRYSIPLGRTMHEMQVEAQADFYIQHPEIDETLRIKQMLYLEAKAIEKGNEWQLLRNTYRVSWVKRSMWLLFVGVLLSFILYLI